MTQTQLLDATIWISAGVLVFLLLAIWWRKSIQNVRETKRDLNVLVADMHRVAPKGEVVYLHGKRMVSHGAEVRSSRHSHAYPVLRLTYRTTDNAVAVLDLFHRDLEVLEKETMRAKARLQELELAKLNKTRRVAA